MSNTTHTPSTDTEGSIAVLTDGKEVFSAVYSPSNADFEALCRKASDASDGDVYYLHYGIKELNTRWNNHETLVLSLENAFLALGRSGANSPLLSQRRAK